MIKMFENIIGWTNPDELKKHYIKPSMDRIEAIYNQIFNELKETSCDQCMNMVKLTPEQITEKWCFGKPFCMFNIEEQLEQEKTNCIECDRKYCDRKCTNELYFAYRVVI